MAVATPTHIMEMMVTMIHCVALSMTVTVVVDVVPRENDWLLQVEVTVLWIVQ